MRSSFAVALLILLLGGSTVHAQSCDIFVNASDGSDGNSGAVTAPLRSVEDAYSRASEGDVICLAAGEYAFGADEDGITLAGSHSVTFQLNEFAGADTVLVSAPFLDVAIPGGTALWIAGTTDVLHLGEGVVANSSASRLALTDGVLDISGVSTTIWSGLGRGDTEDSVIEFAGGSLAGNPSWSETPRVIRISGAQTLSEPISLTQELLSTGSRVELDHQGGASISLDISLGDVDLQFYSSATTSFSGSITVPGDRLSLLESTDATLSFPGGIQFSGSAPQLRISVPDVTIGDLSGTHSSRGLLQLEATQARIQAISPSSSEIDIDMSSGLLTVGSPTTPLSLNGDLRASGRILLAGNVDSNGFNIEADAVDAPDTGTELVVSGTSTTIQTLSESDSRLRFTGEGVIQAGGRIRSLNVAGTGTAAILGGMEVDSLTIATNGSIQQSGAGVLRAGTTDVQGGIDLASATSASFEVANSIYIGATSSWAGDPQIVLLATAVQVTVENGADIPAVRSRTISGMVSGEAIGDLTVESGRLSWQHDTTVRASAITVDGGEFQTDVGGLDLDRLTVSAGAALLTADEPLRIGEAVSVLGGSIAFPESGLGPKSGSTIDLVFPSEIVLPALLIDAPGAVTRFFGTALLDAGLHLEDGELSIQENSTLQILGSLSRSSGVFEVISGGVLSLVNPGVTTIEGFSSTVLPSIAIGNTRVELSENATILGTLSVVSGELVVPDGSTLNVSERSVFTNAVVSFGTSTTFFSNGAVTDQGSQWTVDGANLILGGTGHFLGGSYSGVASEMTFRGSVLIDGVISTENLLLEDSVTLTGSGMVTARTRMTLAPQAQIQVNEPVLRFMAAGDDPLIDNGGSISGTAQWTIGNAGGAQPITVSGNGVFGDFVVNLLSDADFLETDSSVDTLRVAGNVSFNTGSIDLGNKPVLFLDTPTLSLNLTDSENSSPGIDGSGFENVLSYSGSFSLRLLGGMTAPYVLDERWLSLPIFDFSIDAFDAANTPPVFPVGIPGSMIVQGGFSSGANSRVLLDEGPLFLASSNTTHQINGHIDGSEAVILQGGDVRLITGASSDITSLQIETGTGATTDLVLSGSINTLIATDSDIDWLADPGQALTLGSMTVEGSTLQFVGVQVSFSSTNLNIEASNLLFEQQSSWVLNGNSSLVIDPQSSWVDVDAQSSSNLILNGEADLDVSVQLPSVSILPGSEARLLANLAIGSELTLSEAVLDLESATLVLEGADLTVTSVDGSVPSVLQGDFASRQAQLQWTETGSVTLEADLQLQAVLLSMDGTEWTVRSDQSRSMVISTGNAAFRSGEVSLEGADIVVSGSTPDLLLFDGGIVRSSTRQEPPASTSAMNVIVDPTQAQHDLHSELVVVGSGNAGVSATSGLSVSSLRIEGSVRLNASGNTVTVSDRLVFGRGNGSLSLAADTEMQIAPEAWVIREGGGTLSSRVTGDSYNLLYHIDDGSWAGVNRLTSSPVLTGGAELAPQLASLHIAAGNSGSDIQEIVLNNNVLIRDTFSAISGRATGTGVISMSPGSWIIETAVDLDAPGQVTSSISPVNMERINWSKSVTSSEPLSFAADVDTLWIAFSRPSLIASLAQDLSVDHMRITSPTEFSSRLRLNGRSVSVQEDLSIEGTRLSSAQVSELSVGGTISLDGGSITDNIRLSVEGTSDMNGAATNLSISVSGNLIVRDPSFSPQTLVFNGSNQSWTVGVPISISTLTMNQSAPGMVDVFGSGDHAQRISISGGLMLAGGVLRSSDVRFTLDGSVSRSAPLDVASHIEAPVERTMQSGALDPLFFPVGRDGNYFPLTLTPSIRPFSDSRISVFPIQRRWLDQTGLAGASGSGLIAEVGTEAMVIESDVNFAQSLPLNLSVVVPTGIEREVDALMILQDGLWSPISGSFVRGGTTSGQLLQQIDATGLLLGESIQLGYGYTSSQADISGRVQWVNLTDQPVTVSLQEENMMVGPESATIQKVLGWSEGDEAFTYSISGTGDWTVSGTGVIRSDGITRVVLSEPDQPSTEHVQDLGGFESIMLYHNAVNAGSISSEIVRGGTTTDGGLLAAGEYSNWIPVPSEEFELHFRSASDDEFLASFTVASQTQLSESELWIVSDANVDQGPLRLLRIASTGMTEALPLITAVGLENGNELPAGLELTSVYPNPFVSRATVTWTLPSPGSVEIEVINALGQRVAHSVSGLMSQGEGSGILDAATWSPGVYFVRVTSRAGGASQVASKAIVKAR